MKKIHESIICCDIYVMICHSHEKQPCSRDLTLVVDRL